LPGRPQEIHQFVSSWRSSDDATLVQFWSVTVEGKPARQPFIGEVWRGDKLVERVRGNSVEEIKERVIRRYGA
jgi:hypothetical protein